MLPEADFEKYSCWWAPISCNKPDTFFNAARIWWVTEPEESGERLWKFGYFHASVGCWDVTGNGVGVIKKLYQHSFRAVEDVGAINCQEVEGTTIVGRGKVWSGADLLGDCAILLHIIQGAEIYWQTFQFCSLLRGEEHAMACIHAFYHLCMKILYQAILLEAFQEGYGGCFAEVDIWDFRAECYKRWYTKLIINLNHMFGTIIRIIKYSDGISEDIKVGLISWWRLTGQIPAIQAGWRAFGTPRLIDVRNGEFLLNYEGEGIGLHKKIIV